MKIFRWSGKTRDLIRNENVKDNVREHQLKIKQEHTG